jgi:hypothetical protein
LSTAIWGILTGIISGALVAFSVTPTGHSLEVHASQFRGHPTCSDPKWLLQVPDSQIFSDSFFVNSDHSPALTIDGDLRSAWLQWWPTNDLNKGTSRKNNNLIYWVFPQQYDVRLVCVVDGWMDNDLTYKETLPISGAALLKIKPGVPVPVPDNVCRNPHAFKDFIKQGTSYQWQGINVDYATQGLALVICDVSPESEKSRPDLEMAPVPGLDNVSRPLVGLSEIRFYYVPDFCIWPGVCWHTG